MERKRIGYYIAAMLILSAVLITISIKTKSIIPHLANHIGGPFTYEMNIHSGDDEVDHILSAYSEDADQLYVMNRVAGVLDIVAVDHNNEQNATDSRCLKRINIGQLASMEQIDCSHIDKITVSKDGQELSMWKNQNQVMKISTAELL